MRAQSTRICAVAAASATTLALVVASAPAQDLQVQRDSRQAQLAQAKEQGQVLTTQISGYSDQINQLAGEIATLRAREAQVASELREIERRLDTEKDQLGALRERLGRSLKVLSNRLVDIYKSDQPDALTVILDSHGFDDLVNRYGYLKRIQDQDAGIVDRVRSLRDQTHDAVTGIRDARDEVAAKQAELARTRSQLETREADLDAARGQKAAALQNVEDTQQRLEGDISDLNDRIQAQLAQSQASTTTSDPLPAGPIQGAGSGFIWPVNGPVVSPFGMRWGVLHAGIDIAAPAGTPIRAAKDGTIALVQSEATSGGYGNYTCIDHGGGLSTCYAHQSSFAITSGSVKQGEVIGYVGCTGHCYGDHLHFEVRVNGTPVDPMGYL